MTIGTRNPGEIFRDFCKANDLKEIKTKFNELCFSLNVDTNDTINLYNAIKSKLSPKDAKGLWAHLDKRAQQKVYMKGKACQGKKVCNGLFVDTWPVVPCL